MSDQLLRLKEGADCSLLLSTLSVKLCWPIDALAVEPLLELEELMEPALDCSNDHGTGMSFPLEEPAVELPDPYVVEDCEAVPPCSYAVP
jgi:hypothetical protein